MNHDDCPTDLIAKERRDELSPLERRALGVHLARCASCRAWQQIGRDFDRDATASSNDAAVVQRIADGVRFSSLGPLTRPLPKLLVQRTRAVRWMLLAALASSAAAAAAVTGWQVSRDVPPPEVDQALTRSLAQPIEKPRSEQPNTPVAVATLADARESATAQTAVVRQDPARAAPRSNLSGNAAAAEGESALSLYREANQARRKGDVSRAISIFRQLQQSFPRSAEARLSNVALGGALLESGAAREALQQFDRYLASNGNKNLAAEALYGRARALGALRNRTEERAAWLKLSQAFPRSPYSASATRRLQSLE